MRFWNTILKSNLTHEEALDQMKKYHPYYITRHEWGGFHFIDKYGDYGILLRDGTVITDAQDIFDTDKNDWMIVTIIDEAVEILEKECLI